MFAAPWRLSESGVALGFGQMRIPGVHDKQPAERSRAARRTAASDPAFGRLLAEATAAHDAPASAPLGAASAADAMLRIQEVDTATDRRARGRAIRHADALIDQLTELQADLLVGAIPVARLQALTAMLRVPRESLDDARLNDLIDEIQLRAEVELAKLGDSR